MKLKKLIVQGFKSFKDKTTINFDQGITGIVGPNGCGKSNIVDALFWVMGAQSAKHLRGNSMKDVIFSGSAKYNPGTWAEVSLVLENNTGKHIHIGSKVCNPSEIQITRKLYRNGESDYRINGEPARLKDIQEVFMDTGAGAKSYSIIAQGEINKLVQAKPEERRVMIEEVAGITKFKQKKKESLRKIEQTQSNLERLNDLQVEIEKNLRSLQTQAEKANRAKSLKEKIKRHDLIVNAHKVFDHLKLLKEGGAIISESTTSLEEFKKEKEELETSLTEERKEKSEKSKALDKLQNDYNQVSKELAASEERFNSLCNNLTNKEENLDRENEAIQAVEDDISNREELLKELSAELEEFKAKNEEGIDTSDLEEKIDSLEELASSHKEELEEIESELSQTEQDKVSLDQKIFKNKSKLDEYSNNLEDISKEIEELEEQYSSFTIEMAGLGKSVQELELNVEEMSSKHNELKNQKENVSKNVLEARNTLNTLSKEKIQKESKLESLLEIKRTLEGSKEGTINFLDHSQNSESFDIIGNQVISEDDYAKACQTLISDISEKLISKTGDSKTLQSWLTENENKSLDFMKSVNHKSYNEIKERLEMRLDKKVIGLNDCLKISGEYESQLKPILDGYFVVEDLVASDLEKLSDLIDFKGISSKSGLVSITHRSGAYQLNISSSLNTGMGIVERNNLISELETSLVSLNDSVPQKEEELKAMEQNLLDLNNSFEALSTELSELKTSYASQKSSLESKEKAYSSGSSRLEILKNRKNEISKSRLDILEQEESIENEFQDLKEKVEFLSSSKEDKKEEFDNVYSELNSLRVDLKEKKVEAASLEGRMNSLLKQVEDVEKQLSKYADKKNNSVERITEYKEQILKIEEDISELDKNNKITASEIQSQESSLKDHKLELENLNKQMTERENRVRKLTKEVSALEKLINEKRLKMQHALVEEEQVTRDIFEKYQIDLRECLGRFLEFNEADYEPLTDISSVFTMESEEGQIEVEKVDYEFVRKYGQDLKDSSYKLRNYKSELSRLGEINWQAVEDYDRQKLRSNFLKDQESELKQSLEDLELAISHIDEKSKERFKFAFDEVNSRFTKVFPIIFGGGSAQLRIIGDINDPECGVEIFAQPPGKKIQNNNSMSGGEKALTAVSLIFSIFLVKPSPFCLLDEVDAPLDDANVGRFNDLLREMSQESQFILITHNKKTMELNDTLYGVTMQEPGVSKAVSVQLH